MLQTRKPQHEDSAGRSRKRGMEDRPEGVQDVDDDRSISAPHKRGRFGEHEAEAVESLLQIHSSERVGSTSSEHLAI